MKTASQLVALLLVVVSACAQEPDTAKPPWTPLILHPVKDAATHELLRAALTESDPLVRERALEALAFIRDPADAARVRALLNSESLPTRQQAAKVAAQLGLTLSSEQRALSEQASPGKLSPPPPEALRSSNVALLVRAVQALDGEAARRESATLLALLRRPEVVVREAAMNACSLGKITAAAPELLRQLDDADEGLRLAACRALFMVGQDIPQADMITAMVRRMELDPSSMVREAAGLVLVLPKPADQPAIDALLKLFQHPRGETRASAAGTAGILWAKPELAPALHPLLSDREDLVARAAANALGILKNPNSKALLLTAFETRGPVVQERAAVALGELRSTNAVPALVALLPKTTDEALKVSIVEALGKIGDPRALPPLRQVLLQILLNNNLPRAREAAFGALTRFRDKLAVPRAIDIVTKPVVPPLPGAGPTYDEDYIRIAALRFLAEVGDRAAGAAVLAGLKDPVNREVRPVVAETLERLLGKNYRPLPDQDFRRYFIESMTPNPVQPVRPPGVALAP